MIGVGETVEPGMWRRADDWQQTGYHRALIYPPNCPVFGSQSRSKSYWRIQRVNLVATPSTIRATRQGH